MKIIIVLFVAASCLYGKTTSGITTGRAFQILRHNVNQVELCVSNYGKFGQDETGNNSGCWWPIGTNHTYIYGAGPWVGAVDSVVGDTMVTAAFMPHGGADEFAPGLCGMSVSHPEAIIYMYPDPWPPPAATFPMAPQEPVSHQDSWCCFNDCDIEYHIVGDTRPIGIEVYQTVYVWNLSLLENGFFITYEIKNVLGQNLKELYFGSCADNDIGNESGTSANDRISAIIGEWYVIDGDSFYVDNLAFQWQEVEEPGTPPWFPGVVGYDLVRTPYDIVENADKDNDGILDQYERDSAYYVTNLPSSQWDIDNDGLPDWRDPSEIPQVGMTAFKRFTLNLEPGLDFERYMTLAGYNFRTGAYEPYDTVPPDPDDQRFLQCSGPFDLMPDSTITVVLALVFANWHGIYLRPDTALILVDYWAQFVHDMNWFVPGPPPSPSLALIPGDVRITLVWGNAPETSPDSWFDLVGTDPSAPYYDPYYRQYDFEGYRAWKSITGQAGSWELLTSCDLADGIVFEDTTQPDSIRLRAEDTGIFHIFTDDDVRNGFPYYYAVTSFDHNYVRTTEGFDTFPKPVWFESMRTAISAMPRRDPANYVAPGEPVIEYLSGNDQIVELVGAAVAYPQEIDPGYALYIEYLGPDTATAFYVDENNVSIPYTGARYTALLKDDAGVLDTISYVVTIGAGYVPHEVVPPENGMFINPDIGTPVLPAVFPVFETIESVSGTYPTNFLISGIGVPLPAAEDSTDTLYDHGMWAWRGNDYEILWRPKNAGGIVNTVTVTDLVTGEDIPYQQFQNTPSTRHLGAGWCFSWYGNLGVAWTKQSHDTLQTQGPTIERTRYLYLNGGIIGLRNGLWVLDTILPSNGATWIVRANRDYLPPSIFGEVRITGTPGVFTDTSMALNVKVVPNPYIITNEWQTRLIQRRLKFINLPNECTIRIFNLNGELVRTMMHRETSEGGVGNDLGGDEWWDVLSENRQLIASGVYIFHIESEVGEQVGKFVVID